jgi:RecB family exonuclease
LSSIKVRSFEELDDFELLALSDFSYSRIDTYKMCPSKYFFSYVLKEPRQFNPPAVLGNILHDVLENILDNDKELDITELKSEYNNLIPKWDPDNKISVDLIHAGNTMLDEFYDRNSGSDFNIYAKELDFSIVIGLYHIRGFIDRIDLIGNRVVITDYKSGKNEVAAKDIHSNLQLGIYALAASLLFPDKEIYAELYYLRSGRKKGHLFTADDIENVKVNLVDNINKIINDLNFTPTSNTRVCSFCDHAKSGACGVGVYRNSRR